MGNFRELIERINPTMTLTVSTLDENEAMRLRSQGWKFKSMDASAWTLVWPDANEWPPDPRGSDPPRAKAEGMTA